MASLDDIIKQTENNRAEDARSAQETKLEGYTDNCARLKKDFTRSVLSGAADQVQEGIQLAVSLPRMSAEQAMMELFKMSGKMGKNLSEMFLKQADLDEAEKVRDAYAKGMGPGANNPSTTAAPAGGQAQVAGIQRQP